MSSTTPQNSEDSENPEEMQRHIERGLRWAAIRQAILFIVGTAGILTYTRMLGPDGIGRFSLALIVYYLLRAIAQSPFRDAVIYYRREDHAHATFICLIIFGGIAVTITVFAAPWIGLFYELPDSVPVIQAMCIAFFCYSLSVVPAALLLKKFKFAYHETLLALSEVVFTSVVIFLAWQGWDVWALVIAHISQAGFWAAAAWWAAGYKPKWITEWAVYKDVLRYSGNLMGSELIGYINGNADNAAVGTLGQTSLGLYTFGENNSSFMVLGIGLPISQIALPSLSAVREKADEFRQVFASLIRLVSVISTPGHVGAFLLADYIVVLFFGVEWLEAIWVIRAYFSFRLFNTLLTISNAAVSAYGRPDLRLKQDLLQLPLFLIGIWLGLTYWGTIEGVSWLLVVVRTFMAFVYFGLTIHFTPLTWGDSIRTLSPSFIAAATLGMIIFVGRWFNPFDLADPTDFMSALLPILLYVPAGIAGYTFLYYKLDSDGFRDVIALGRRVFSRENKIQTQSEDESPVNMP